MNPLKAAGLGVVTGALLMLAIVMAFQWHNNRVPAVAGGPASAIEGQATRPVPVTQIQAYPKGAKVALHLPEEVAADPAKHVVAATTVPESRRSQTVTAVTDEATGVTALYTRAEPLPWFSRKDRWEIAVASGFQDAQTVTQFELSKDFVQIKMIRLGLTAQVNTGGREFFGVRAAAAW